MVLANPEIAKLPAWVVALVAAGGLAAALSTAAGLLLVISASVSHDLLKSVMWKNMPQNVELRMARIAAAFAVIVAGSSWNLSTGICCASRGVRLRPGRCQFFPDIAARNF